ncbi:MAG: hypothetical protein ACO1QS_05290 [Verrucomicrobiota bacterium]
MLALCLAALGARAAAPKPGPAVIVTVETRDFRVEFAGERAWTFQRILHQGQVVAGPAGFCGTVFAAQSGKWIGTGHNEGGIEQIESVTLTVDGQKRELTHQAVYRGQKAVLYKHSRMGPFKLEAIYSITDDALREEHRYEAVEETKVSTLYAFMHTWLPDSTEWLAVKPDGQEVAGVFASDGDFELQQDVKWTASYNPKNRRAMLAWHPQPFLGQGLKTAYWDKTVYHKLYLQLYANTTIVAGTKFSATIVIKGVETDAAGWKDSVRKMAAQLEKSAE